MEKENNQIDHGAPLASFLFEYRHARVSWQRYYARPHLCDLGKGVFECKDDCAYASIFIHVLHCRVKTLTLTLDHQ